jgi:Protein of unknown function (DUF4256)
MAKLSKPQRETLLATLQARFEAHAERHKGIKWDAVLKRIESHPEKLRALQLMEETGGEPDVIGTDPASGGFLFVDCSAETPAGRVSLCYDDEALAARKEHKPKDSAIGMAAEMGVEILTEEQYHQLQRLGEFDRKTSSWVLTPPELRKLGGALFGDRRYGRVFTYHNGVQSYYAVRGFRGMVAV